MYQHPRFVFRTKSAILTVALLLIVFAVSACVPAEPQVIERTVVVEVIREVEVVREVEVEVEKIVEVVVTATPTPAPKVPPTPAATPTPNVDDYFVVLHQGERKHDGIGVINFYSNTLSGKRNRIGMIFREDRFYLEHLRNEGVISSQQHDDYFNDEPIQKISIVAISTATYELWDNDPYNADRVFDGFPSLLFHYAEQCKQGDSWFSRKSDLLCQD